MFRGGKYSPDVLYSMGTLEEALSKWTDSDVASFEVGVCLGFWPSGDESFREQKGVFWTNNPLGNALFMLLGGLVRASMLESRDEPDLQYRWKVEETDV